MENQVSIIINGVRYDAVDAPMTSYPCSYCDAVDECVGHNEDVLCAIHNCVDKIFKKSDKVWSMSKTICCKTCKNFKNEDADGYGWCELQQEEVTGYFSHPCHEPLNNGWIEITPDNVDEIDAIDPNRVVIATMIEGIVFSSTRADSDITLKACSELGGYYCYVLPELKIE